MEFGVRDWMIIIGVLLILAVLLDGYRRMRNERRGNIRISLNKQFLNSVADDEELTSELPSGGARVIGSRRSSPSFDDTPPLGDGNLTDSEFDLEQPVPVLMESVAEEEAAVVVDYNDPLDYEPIQQDAEPGQIEMQAMEANEPDEQEYPVTEEPVATSSRAQATDVDQEVVVINVVAKNEPFKGPDLLHILLACDLRFGDMNIFHRHEESNGRGATQFSMANSVKPGDFDLDNIDDFTTPGVSFFMSVPGPKESIKAFECMVETAQCLATNLGGELLDDSRSAMTNQTLEHCRLRLREFERRQLTQHA